MGVPGALLMLLLLLLLLCPVAPTTPTTPAPSCFAPWLSDAQDLNLTKKISGCAQLDWSPFHQQRRLWLSHNGIVALSPWAQLGPRLEELDLSYNQLQELPTGFFSQATALRTLRLEGNPLPAVPTTIFTANVTSLSVSCHCDVVGTILAPCARPGTRCLCFRSPQDPSSITEFHGQQCGVSTGLVAGVAGVAAVVAVLVAVGAGVVCYRRRRAGVTVASAGWGKQDPSAPPRQSRYISRDGGIGTADASDATGAADTPDYENIFVSPGTAPGTAQGWAPGWQEQWYSPQVPEDEDYFLEGEADPGDQPIYANTLGPSEDIYIVPGQ